MKLRFTKLNDKAITPTRGSNQAAGYDLYSCEDAIIYENTTQMIHTGIAIEIPEGYFGAIYARSGLATKEGLRPANCVGVIDSDYRGEIMVALHRDAKGGILFGDMFTDHSVPAGTRIAQLVIQPYASVEFEEVADLSETDRGAGGFGSTGTN